MLEMSRVANADFKTPSWIRLVFTFPFQRFHSLFLLSFGGLGVFACRCRCRAWVHFPPFDDEVY
jgi:hypothetical protein